MIGQLVYLLAPLFVVALPFLIVVGVLVAGVALVVVIIAIVGAVRSGFVHEPQTEQLDVEELFDEQPVVPSAGRNDSI